MLIKAEAIGVNYIDTYFRSGQYPRELPFILGTEVWPAPSRPSATASTGSASATGWSVPRLPAAMPNMPRPQRISTAEVPDGVTADVAASALLKGLTAHYLLKSVYPVQEGDTVLVHAGAGGVGLILTQWATCSACG